MAGGILVFNSQATLKIGSINGGLSPMELGDSKPRFSDRIGVTQPRSALQIGTMDDPLRNSIWNGLCMVLNRANAWEVTARIIAVNMVKVPMDSIEVYGEPSGHDWVRAVYFGLIWYDIYNLIELISD